MCRPVEVGKCEVFDATLFVSVRSCSSLSCCPSTTYLLQQASQHDEEPHELSGVRCEDLIRSLAAHVFGRSAHSWGHDLTRSVCQQFGEPLEHLLDLLWVRLLQVLLCELYADV